MNNVKILSFSEILKKPAVDVKEIPAAQNKALPEEKTLSTFTKKANTVMNVDLNKINGNLRDAFRNSSLG